MTAKTIGTAVLDRLHDGRDRTQDLGDLALKYPQMPIISLGPALRQEPDLGCGNGCGLCHRDRQFGEAVVDFVT